MTAILRIDRAFEFLKIAIHSLQFLDDDSPFTGRRLENYFWKLTIRILYRSDGRLNSYYFGRAKFLLGASKTSRDKNGDMSCFQTSVTYCDLFSRVY